MFQNGTQQEMLLFRYLGRKSGVENMSFALQHQCCLFPKFHPAVLACCLHFQFWMQSVSCCSKLGLNHQGSLAVMYQTNLLWLSMAIHHPTQLGPHWVRKRRIFPHGRWKPVWLSTYDGISDECKGLPFVCRGISILSSLHKHQCEEKSLK